MATEQQDQPKAKDRQEQAFAPGQAEEKLNHGNLSAEIAAVIDRQPGDRVRVTWVNGASYRCNWWAPGNTNEYDNPGMYGLVVTTHTVRQSRFITATKDGTGKLVIREHSRSGGLSTEIKTGT